MPKSSHAHRIVQRDHLEIKTVISWMNNLE